MTRLTLILAVLWSAMLPTTGCFAEVRAVSSSDCAMPCCGGACCCAVNDAPAQPLGKQPATPTNPQESQPVHLFAFPPRVSFVLPAPPVSVPAPRDSDDTLDRRDAAAALDRLCRWLT